MWPTDYMLGRFRQRRLDLLPYKEHQNAKKRGKGDNDKFGYSKTDHWSSYWSVHLRQK